MNKLWTFGDSFTAGHGCNKNDEYYEKYYKEGDKLWSQHLADELDLELINLGVSGSSNEMIIDSIMLNYNYISADDVVIIQKSYSHRLDVPNMGAQGHVWVTVFANKDFDLWYSNFLSKEQYQTAIDFAYHFSDNSKYKKRQNLRFSFLSKCFIKDDINFFLWDISELKNKKLHHVKYQTIDDATNNEISDYHFSFNGHFEFYKWISKKIKNENIHTSLLY
jgi:hypothetical protein